MRRVLVLLVFSGLLSMVVPGARADAEDLIPPPGPEDYSAITEIANQTADGASVFTMDADEEDLVDYMGTDEAASYAPPMKLVVTINGYLDLGVGQGTVVGDATTYGYFARNNGLRISCSGLSGYMDVLHTLKVEGKRLTTGVPPTFVPISQTNSDKVEGFRTCNDENWANGDRSARIQVPWTADYTPSQWTSTHTVKASGMKWTSPGGRVVKYANTRMVRTCTMNYPGDADKDLVIDGTWPKLHCETVGYREPPVPHPTFLPI